MKLWPGPPAGGQSSRMGLCSLAVMALAIAGQSDAALKPLITSTYVSFLGFSRSTAGFIIGAEAAATAVTVAIVVSVLGRWRSHRTVVAGAVLIVLGNLLSTLTQDPYRIAVTRILAGIGHGAMAAVCAAAIATFVQAERVSALVAVSVAIVGTSLMLAVPWAQGLLGPAPLFIVMAALVVLPLAMLRWIPENDGKIAVGDAEGRAVHHKGLVAVSLMSGTFFYLSVGSFWPYAAEFGKLAGLTYQGAAAGTAAATMAAVTGSLGVMLVSKRVPKQWGIGGAVLGAMLAQGLLSRSHDPWIFYIACMIFMFSWGIFYPLFMGVLSELDRTGRANGYFFILAAGAIAVAPGLAGLVIGIGAPPQGNLENLLWMSVLCLVPALGMVVAPSIRNRQKPAPSAP